MAPDSSAPKHTHSESLAARIGTQTFQLQPSVGTYGKGHAEHVNLGHIFFDAPAPALFINDEKIEQVLWNDVCNVVAWVSPRSSVIQGRLSFINDCREAIGTITYRTGESVIVTASVAPARGGGAPPAYGLAVMDGAIGTGTLGFDVKLAEPFATVAAVDPSSGGGEAPVKIRVTEFKTKREGEPGTWYSLGYAVKEGRVYCFVDDVDISHDVILKHEDSNEVHLVKEKRDLTDKTLNYRFDIVLTRPMAEKDQEFSGTWEQDGKTWTWKGVYGKVYEHEAGPAQDAVQMVGSDGLTITELLTMTSLRMDSAGNDSKKDMAQEEGDRIFAKIILHSAPEDIRKVLSPDMAPLEDNERKIAELGPEYLKIAGVINVMNFLKHSSSVAHEQQERIDEQKCNAFVSACAQFAAPPATDVDYVTKFGWDRENDKDKIDMIQTQYRNVAQACYRLGYRKQVLRFQQFLKNAKEWYGILAKYLTSRYHLANMSDRAASNDTRIQHEVYDWHNKLVILFEQAGDVGDAPSIAEVIAGLQGAVGVAGVSGIEWDSEFASKLKNFFENLDEVEKDTKLGVATTEAMKKELEEYKHLRELFQERDELTWSELGKRLIEGIEGHAKLLGPKVSVAEVADNIAENKVAPAAWAKGKLSFLRRAACSAIHLVGMVLLTKTLVDGSQSLGLPEQISMMVSLMDAVAKTSEIASKVVGWVGRQIASTSLMKGIGEGFRKLLESRALGWINAATTWMKGIVDKGIPSVVKGFLARNWGTIAKGIGMLFGFFVSVASLVASTFEFIKAWKEGSKINAVFAAEQLFFAAVSTIAFGVEIVASLADATAVAAIAGTIGIWMAGIGIVVAVIALIYELTREHPDPIKDFITKYGKEYGLLK